MSRWRNYADEVEVAVVTEDSPIDEPSEVWAVLLPKPPAGPEDFEEEVTNIAYDADSEVFHPNVLTSRRTYFSWGADAVQWRYVLEIAAHYVDEALAGVIAYKFVQWWQRIEGSDEFDYPVTRETAEERAKWAILLAYKNVARDDLELLAEERDIQNNTWTFEYRASAGRTFGVKVGSIGGIPTAVNVRRHADPSEGKDTTASE